MNLDSFAIGTVTWLVTFAAHSTVLLGAAWLLASRLGRGAHRDEERWWKVALIAGIVTASGQTALGIKPLTGEFLIPAVHTETAAALDEEVLVERATPVALAPRPVVAQPVHEVEPELEPAPVLGTIEQASATRAANPWVVRAVGFWLVCACLGLLALTLSWMRLSNLLRHRTQLLSSDGGQRGSLHELFEELAAKNGMREKVRLSASNRLSSPITLGIVRREVCVPHAAVYSLEADEQRAMLAHELAHAKRRDPAWLIAMNVLERVFFFQPLLRIARSRQQHLAEYLCDDWALRQTKDPVSLASCLTEVAGWVVGNRPCRLAPSMAAPGIELRTRVSRILDTNSRPRLGRARFALLPLALFSGLAVLYGMPSVRADANEVRAERDERVNLTSLRLALAPSDPAIELKLAVEEVRAASAPERVLTLLDQEFELLATEIKLLRREAAKIEGSEQILRVLNELESRLQMLSSRRERLSQLISEIDLTQPR